MLGRARLNWREVGILYRREMRAAFREKTILLNSILLPIFLYPLLLWVAFTALTFVQGQTEGVRSRLVVKDWPVAHPDLRRRIESDPQIELLDPARFKADPAASIRRGQFDALVEFAKPEAAEARLTNNFQARITFDQSKDRSASARDRTRADVDRYRADWLRREARGRGIDAAEWQGFTLASRNVASPKQLGSFVLGLMLPVIFVVMVAIGCFNPAVDTLAGDRERNTWETLMSTAASRVSIVTSKYLYVASLGGLAGVLNLIAVLVTFKPILGALTRGANATIEGSLPFGAIPILALAAVLLAAFVAAGMLIFAAFARTFKEGQAMITPFYLLILIPCVFLQVPGLKLSPQLACVPVVNVTLMVREAVSGVFHWLPIVLTIAASLTMIALCVALVAFILRFEDVVTGSYTGSLGKFLKDRLLRRTLVKRARAEVAI
jgi:sodium transport system permease protein